MTISIHSAARAETEISWSLQAMRKNFNPLRREGGDTPSITLLCNSLLFQSTPPRGRRRLHGYAYGWVFSISIHSAARAETSWDTTAFSRFLFQSTPPRGRRPAGEAFLLCPVKDFNPLRREGGDLTPMDCPVSSAHFNPLRREGGDLRSGQAHPFL